MSEWSHYRQHPGLKVNLLHAHFRQHSYPRHSHEYYVIALVEAGLQSFSLGREKLLTPPGGLIFINPGESHTGEPAAAGGFRYRAMYPTIEHMHGAAVDFAGGLPQFNQPRSNDARLAARFMRMHALLMRAQPGLEAEAVFISTLAELLQAFGSLRPTRLPLAGIQPALELIHTDYNRSLSLGELAASVSLSRYHFLRSFRNQVGMPPHTYIENYRIAVAQRLLAARKPPALVAAEVGFSSQSHFTRRFRRTLGVTPARYAALVH